MKWGFWALLVFCSAELRAQDESRESNAGLVRRYSLMPDPTALEFPRRMPEKSAQLRTAYEDSDCQPKFPSDETADKVVIIFDGLSAYSPITIGAQKARIPAEFLPKDLEEQLESEKTAFASLAREIALLPETTFYYYSQDGLIQDGVSKALRCAEGLKARAFIVIGFSNGGDAALAFAKHFTGKLDRVITMDPVPRGLGTALDIFSLGLLKPMLLWAEDRPETDYFNFFQRNSFIKGNLVYPLSRVENVEVTHRFFIKEFDRLKQTLDLIPKDVFKAYESMPIQDLSYPDQHKYLRARLPLLYARFISDYALDSVRVHTVLPSILKYKILQLIEEVE